MLRLEQTVAFCHHRPIAPCLHQNLLDEDAALTRALAAIGLVNTVSSEVGTIRTLGAALGVEEAALEEALKLEARHGMRLVARQESSAVALV